MEFMSINRAVTIALVLGLYAAAMSTYTFLTQKDAHVEQPVLFTNVPAADAQQLMNAVDGRCTYNDVTQTVTCIRR